MSDLVKRDQAAVTQCGDSRIAKTQDAMQMLVAIARTQNSIAQVAPKTPPVVVPEVVEAEVIEWTDRSGNDRPLVQTDKARQPQYKGAEISVQSQAIPDRYAEKVQIHELPEVPANVRPRMTRSFVKLGILALEKEIEEGGFRQTFITESILIETIAAVANGQRTRQQLAEEMRKFLAEFGFYFIQWSVDDFFRFVDDARAELKKIS